MSTQQATPVQAPQLTAMDRCDGCGSQAFIKVELPGVDLLFCSHHYNKPGLPGEPSNKEKLEAIAVSILDESWRLLARPTGYLDDED